MKTHEGTRLRVVRVGTDTGQRIVGVRIPRERVWSVLRALGINHRLESPEKIFHAVLNEGGEVTLAANIRLKQGDIHGEKAIELCGADPYKFAQLQEIGLINAQISYKQRFFIPTDEIKGIEILSALLQLYPVIQTEESAEEEPQPPAKETITADGIADAIIDLAEWIIPAGEPDSGESELQESQPRPASEIGISEEQPSPLPATFIETRESSSGEPSPLVETSPLPASPRRARHPDRESLGQLAFDFCHSRSEPAGSNETSVPPV